MSGKGVYQTNVIVAGLLVANVGSRIKGTDTAYMNNFKGK
jgi:hypothetical protein